MGPAGGVCYFCHWGWPTAIVEICARANDYLDNPHAMPDSYAHIVWSDENFDSALWCIQNREKNSNPSFSKNDHDVVEWSLLRLMDLPLVVLNPPDNYDGNYPEDFPPPPPWKMSYEELTGKKLTYPLEGGIIEL